MPEAAARGAEAQRLKEEADDEPKWLHRQADLDERREPHFRECVRFPCVPAQLGAAKVVTFEKAQIDPEWQVDREAS